MSAMNVRSFNDAQNRRTGPTLNALSRERLGWLHRSRIWTAPSIEFSETVILAALNRQNIDGYLMAKFGAPSRDPTQQVSSTYTLEFREATGWDQGIQNDMVIIHEVRTDGLIRLLTNFNGGRLQVGSEFIAPNSTVVARLLAIDSPTHTATLRVWRLPRGGSRTVRISYIEYNPPGFDVENEYVVIQNDTAAAVTMTGWTLRDLANHVFIFPAFTLQPGFSVNVWTKAGMNDAENLYWGRRAAIWNNPGDSSQLRDDQGNEVSRYVY
ncbi:lamin tail domain-containing protein [Candidatus Poribacteria bacterium]|nr:lamin tail domain-containing protein [Candidatus Poribacteria bacterium]